MDVSNQSVGSIDFFWGLWGRIFSMPPSQLLVVCWPSFPFLGLWLHLSRLCIAFSLCVCLHVQISFFNKDTDHIGLRAHPNPVWIHFNLITFAKTLFPNKTTVIGSSGLGFKISPWRIHSHSSGWPQAWPFWTPGLSFPTCNSCLWLWQSWSQWRDPWCRQWALPARKEQLSSD